MKKTLPSLLTFICLLFAAQLFANTVAVKGTVKDSLNNPVANRTVKIYADSSCNIVHTVTTNANGYYIDTLSCSNTINKVTVVVEDCKGARIVQNATVGAGGYAESNFRICSTTQAPPVNCNAVFTYSSVATGVKFTAGASTAPAGDSITSYTWNFGDSTAPAAGTKDPLHVYNHAGTYNACVTIKTKKGCESTYCKAVVFQPQVSCKATASFTIEKIAPKKYRFNSTQSNVLAGDSIFSRIWQFGDGTSTDGNKIVIEKEFKDTGVFNVCLKVVSVKGCDNKTCATVTVRDTTTTPTVPTNCKASFTYTIKDSTIKFNSAASVASSVAGDSIISRTWSYTDSTHNLTLGGNVVDPSFDYSKPGAYKVTLVIKTKKGCESKTTVLVVINPPHPPVPCKAAFTYTIKDSTIYFNSAASSASNAPGDSIISRTWSYTDSANNVSLGGNVVAPFYVYSKPGSYKVTLVIKTKAGCESRTSVVVVIPAPQAASCKASFVFTVEKGSVKFKSTSTGATALDSVTGYTWIFGDSTAPVQNSKDPLHVYPKSGKYAVTLYIKTKSGCESKFTEHVSVTVAPPVNCAADVQFTAERVSLKRVQFNSSMSKTNASDSIIQRSWKFGDGTALNGNEIKPLKEFPAPGIYNACLEIKTVNGCVAQACKQVTVQDTVSTPQSSVDYIKIISINPNPVITKMVATIYSRNTNAEAEITVYDIYGAPKLTIKKLLAQGNNVYEINLGNLYHGPYFLKVSTRSARDAKAFYKL
ncbi:PKD domain-containing protein [Sediminibacterium roseum]|uniref:PKD domain-containing protein n=1 Tax=Sediminibacterium roseum TaxID=1978412 RepID=A0ABW9ZQ99_9BACT|nr:PKD domain-containing protein [Sediminibacterium roseum]NCI49277.1 PKD domain-containing protein [Sediminibacterium roseum]